MNRDSLRSAPRNRSRGRHRSGWNPRRLSSLRAWYDAELGQPKYSGVGAYVQLDGASTDNISTPDSITTSFNNDIEVVMRVYVNDWSTGAIQTLCGKYLSTGNQRSWRFYTSATGTIGLTVSADGTAVTTLIVTPTNPLPDATWIWIRLRLDLTNGSNSVGYVDTATDTGDNALVPTSWTANGTNTSTTISGVFDGTAVTEIGSFNSGTSERLSGRVGRCIVKSGFDGSTVVDFNATDCYGPGYLHSNGYYWTLGLPKIYDRSPNNIAPATFGAGTNQPIWLSWDGRPLVHLPGANGNYISCPDAAALDITGDIDLIVRIRPTSWTAATGALIAKYTGAVRSYRLDLNSSGSLRMYLTTDGSTEPASATSSASVGFSAGQTGWVRATWRASDGRVQYFTAPDSESVPTVWAQLGVDKLLAIPSIYAGNASLEVGASFGGTAVPFNGQMLRAIVRSGIDGTTVADFNAQYCGQSGYTDSLSNVWTVNRSSTGRKTVVQSPTARSNRSIILHGTDDWIDVPAAALPPMGIADNATASIVARLHATPVSFGRLFSTEPASNEALYIGVQTNHSGYIRLSDGTNFAAVSSASIAAAATVRGIYTANVANRGATGLVEYVNVTTGSADSTAVGAVTHATLGKIGRRGDSAANFQDFEFEALVLRSSMTNAKEHGLVVAYYRGGV